ncbi:MAG: leucine-rich repeat domain-containing protein [Myxococcales bacterium]|nr:leucine-rich repeat domain-containing protein [Myxococcales bacterium]
MATFSALPSGAARPKVRIYQTLREALRARGPVEHLRIAASDLRRVSPAVRALLKRLRVLELRIRRTTSLPTAVLGCERLEVLKVGVEDTIDDWVDRRRGLKTLPSALDKLSRLRRLDLSFNQLTTLPAALRRLKALRVLSLQGNQLARWPSVLSELSRLRELDLSLNPLTRVPSSIAKLRLLERLNLDAGAGEGPYGGKLSQFPVGLLRLSKLRVLVLGGQPFEAWLAPLSKMQQLRVLQLGEWVKSRSSDPRALEKLRRLRPRLAIVVDAYD